MRTQIKKPAELYGMDKEMQDRHYGAKIECEIHPATAPVFVAVKYTWENPSDEMVLNWIKRQGDTREDPPFTVMPL